MAMSDDEIQKAFYTGTDVLGGPAELKLAGAAPPGGGAAAGALPAPSGPGGIGGGFMGGGRGQQGAGAGGGSLAQQALDAAIKTGKFGQSLMGSDEQRGDTGGVSLSDELRSAFQFPTAGPGLSREVGAGLAPPSDIFNPDLIGGGGGGVGGASGAGAEGVGAGGLGANLGTGVAGAGAAAAILGLIAQQTGDKDLGEAAQALGATTGGVGAAGAAAAGAAAGAEGAAGAAAAGAGAAGGAALAPIGVVLAVNEIINLITGGEGGNLSDLWGAGREGHSKMVTAERQEAERMGDRSRSQMGSALQAATDAETAGVTDPAQLRAIAEDLLGGESSYFQAGPLGRGASSKFGIDSPSGDPYTQGWGQWLGINKYLTDQGQPGLTVPSNISGALGLTQPVNQAELTQYGDPATWSPEMAALRQWGPMGQPPADLSSPEGQAWVNKAMVAKMNETGIPMNAWNPAASPAAAQAGQIAQGAFGGGGGEAEGLLSEEQRRVMGLA